MTPEEFQIIFKVRGVIEELPDVLVQAFLYLLSNFAGQEATFVGCSTQDPLFSSLLARASAETLEL